MKNGQYIAEDSEIKGTVILVKDGLYTFVGWFNDIGMFIKNTEQVTYALERLTKKIKFRIMK